MELEYMLPCVDARSRLNSEQKNDFFNQMKKTVWQVIVSKKRRRKKTQDPYTGVCISSDGLILTTYFDTRGLLEVAVMGIGERTSSVSVLFQNKEVGITLLLASHLQSFDHAKISQETEFGAGRHLYTIVHPKNATSSIFLAGCLAYPYDPDCTSPAGQAPACRTIQSLPTDVHPGLGEDVSLLQIDGMLASNEFPDRKECAFKNKFGFKEGRGSPVFTANGHLVGIISFQQGAFDFAIPTIVFKRHLTDFVPSSREHGPSEKGQRKDKKGKGILSH